MLSIGRISADGGGAPGWRYLWEQVSEGAEDYYSADVARGEAPGRWGGTAAEAELGLSGAVTEEQMERVFGRLMHPTRKQVLGRGPTRFRSVADRLVAAEKTHREQWTAAWTTREIELLQAGASAGQVRAEFDGHRRQAGERWAEVAAGIRRGGDRVAVAAFDLTFSPPKSVSVLWAAADAAGREIIWAAHRAGVTAALAYIEREAAWSRAGHNGVRQVGSSGMVIASFDHRMSRRGDVQIHTHNAVLNRLRCDDGGWRALDGRAVYWVAASAGALYDRVRETCLERDLGVRHEQRKPNGPREIVGVDDDICRLFSSRRVQVEGRLAEMVATYTDNHGAPSSEWMTARMSRWATLETRQAKTGTETTTEALTRWESETRAQLARSLSGVWQQATTIRAEPVADPAGRPCDDDVLVAAVAAVDAEKATWTRYDLVRKITQTITVHPGTDPDELLARVDTLVERAVNLVVSGVVGLDPPPMFTIPERLRRRGDGQSVYGQHGAERFGTATGMGCELRILAAARSLEGPCLDPVDVDFGLARVGGLGADQAGAARQVLTSGRRVEALVGPAGTGKTHTMAAVGRLWQEGGGRVLGLAVAENAARTLSAAAGFDTLNVAKLLFEHTERSPARQAEATWRDRYGIEAGALVILDEAGMASRQVIDNLARLCQAASAKLLLVGDPEQLSSPDAGGAFRLVVDQVGAAHLGQVHRFAEDWERQASLRLRDGEVAVLADYDLRARIAGGSEADMEDAAFAAAMADRAMGRRTFLLADTNEQAARLAGRVRDQLVAAGVVDDIVTVALGDGNQAGVGDRVVTRRNDRTNDTGGRFVANRDTWQITHLHPDGAITVARVDPDTDLVVADQELCLGAGYVAVHLQLEYAGTVHAAQGATGTVAHALISPRSTRHGLYVALTRGIEENRAYVICNRPDGADADGTPQDPLAVLANILEGDDDSADLSALTTRDHLADKAASLATLFPIWQDLTTGANQQRWQRAVALAAGERTAATMLSGEAWPTLAARLRLIDAAGIDSAAALTAAATAHTLTGVDDVAAVLHWRLRHTETAATTISADTTLPETPGSGDAEIDAAIAQIAAAMDARTQHLGARTYTLMPDWAAELGARPDPGATVAGDEWRRRAGIVAGYQEAFHLDRPGNGEDQADSIGASPPPTRPDATLWWQRAAAALGRTGPGDLAELDDDHLHAIVERAHQATAGAPRPVDTELRSASAELRAARTLHGHTLAGRTPPDPTAARHIDALIAQVAELEDGRRQRQQWSAANASLHAQSHAAAAELAARTEARTAWPHPDTDTDTLLDELARTTQRLAAASVVAEHHETAGRRNQQHLDDVTAELAALTANQPDVRAAQATVAAEQATAARIDDLRSAITQTRLGRPVLRSEARRDLGAQLADLVNTNPGLAVDPHRRQQRWAAIAERARTTTQRRVDQLTDHLNQTQTTVAEHAEIATRARAEINHHQQRHAALSAELHRRQPPTAVPGTPPEPRLDADAGDSPRPEPSPAGDVMAATTLQAALAAVDQELTAATRVAQRHETLAARWQHTADQLQAELARLNQQHPKLTLANNTIAEQRATALRIDQLREALNRRRLTRPAFRGGQRQSATNELHQLINTNPALALDPAQREQRWTAMINHATIAEQRQADHIARQLEQANTTIHQHTSTIHRARTATSHLTQQHADLRAQLERNPHDPTARTTNNPQLTAGDTTPHQAPLDAPTPSAEHRSTEHPTDLPPRRHHQMRQATRTPTATEQLILP